MRVPNTIRGAASHGLRPRRARLRCAMCVMVMQSAIASLCVAQWTVVNLHPVGATESMALGISQGQQVGFAKYSSVSSTAVLWAGSAATAVGLYPVSGGNSTASGVWNGQQAGGALVGGVVHASVWSGTIASRVDLNPMGASYSQASAIRGGQQVGWSVFGSTSHASLWSGTAASWVDLTPGVVGVNTYAYGISDTQQVGVWGQSAYLWSGTASSGVNLQPSGARTSAAYAVDAGQQVGSVDSAACMWTGTAASYVNLRPAGGGYSIAYAVYAGTQAGFVEFGGRAHAGIWTGSAASWVDLHATLDSSWSESYATGVWSDGTTLTIVGYGVTGGSTRALMWMRPIPVPGTISLTGIAALILVRRRRRIKHA